MTLDLDQERRRRAEERRALLAGIAASVKASLAPSPRALNLAGVSRGAVIASIPPVIKGEVYQPAHPLAAPLVA